MSSKVPISPHHLLFAGKVAGLLPCLITDGREGDERLDACVCVRACDHEDERRGGGGQWNKGVVYKWDPSFFMHRGDIPPSANFAPIAQSPWFIDICIRDLC